MGSSYDPELESDPTDKHGWPHSAADGESGQSSNSTQAYEHPELLVGNEIEAQYSTDRQTSC